MPIAAKIGQQKHLAAIRDSFALIVPFIIAGAFAVLLNNVVFKTDVDFSLAKLIAPHAKGTFFTDIYIVPVMGLIWQGSFAVMGLLVSFGLGYYLSQSKQYENPAAAGMMSTVTVLMLSTWSVAVQAVSKGGKVVAYDAATMKNLKPVSLDTMAIDPASIGATGLFATIIFGLIAVEIYLKLAKVDSFRIKMPDSVPPAVSKSFAALIPAMLTMVVMGTISVIITELSGEKSVFLLISKYIQTPFLTLANSGVGGITLALVYVFFVHLLWSFGLHGTNIMNGVFIAIWQPLMAKNIEIYSKSHSLNAKGLNTFAQPFFDNYVFLGGAGATLTLLVAIFIASRKEEEKIIAKLAVAPGCFNINEPVIFGLPIVLNASYLIPFIIVPIVNTIVAWVGIDVIHFAPKIVTMVPWTTPPVLGPFIASAFAWQALVLAAGIFVLDILIYLPFVKVATREYEKEQEAKNKQKSEENLNKETNTNVN